MHEAGRTHSREFGYIRECLYTYDNFTSTFLSFVAAVVLCATLDSLGVLRSNNQRQHGASPNTHASMRLGRRTGQPLQEAWLGRAEALVVRAAGPAPVEDICA